MSKTKNANGRGIHQTGAKTTDEWLTPPYIIEALGPFDLDPCSPIDRPWDMAKHHFTVLDNGFMQSWAGYKRVWLNPPYGTQMYLWVNKLAQHGNGIALIFNRSDVPKFHEAVYAHVDAVMNIQGRLKFYNVKGEIPSDLRGKKATAPAPSILCAFGEENVEALHMAKREGTIKGTIFYPARRLPIIVIGISATWKTIVSMVLTSAGGEANLARIYDMVEVIAPKKVERNQFYKEKVRQTLQQHFARIKRGHFATHDFYEENISETG